MIRSARPARRHPIRRFLSMSAGVIVVAVTAALVSAPPASARSDEPVWAPVDAAGSQTELGLTADAPVAAFDVDLDAVLPTGRLFARRETVAPATTHVSLPDPTGAFVDFEVQPISVMEDELAARHPELKTFAGHAADDPTVTVRLSVTPLGLSASVRSGDNRAVPWYIDPVPSDAGSSTPKHISYGRDMARVDRADTAYLEPEEEAPVPDEPRGTADKASRQVIRLAMATDPAFARFYGTENVLAAKVVMVARVAQIYNDDLGVQLKLVNDTEKLNFDTDEAAYSPGGACGDDACYPTGVMWGCSEDLLRSNAWALGRILGDDGFDVGHVSLGSGNDGMAYWNVVGVDYWKGGGCTGLSAPVGDVFATDFLSHELGHQFGGAHTMNACHNAQGDSAFEPGSSSTIMGYAGLCRENDLQSNSDPYFSAFSIDQMHYWSGWAGVHEQSTNSVPTVTAPESKTIPVRTPFQLTASGTDPDGDQLTYVWEQNNNGDFGRGLRDPNKLNGPLFRIFGTAADLTWDQAHSYYSGAQNAAQPTPTRVFPDMAQILRGTTNARTGRCDGLDWSAERDCYSEFLPTELYEGNGTGGFDFRVTARDQRADGGGVAIAGVHIGIDRNAGPFEVSSLAQNGESVLGGRPQEISWNVNGTDTPELAPEVRITMSADGGQTFDHVLAERTANDGSATVTFPNVSVTKARIKIEAVDNYFFDVNDADFAVLDTVLQSLQPQAVRAVPGIPAELPTTVVPVYSGMPRDAVPVTWDVSGVDVNTPGTYRALGSGVDGYGNVFSDAVLTIEVGDFSSTDPVSVTVPVGTLAATLADLLPPTVPAQVGTGASRFPIDVVWDTTSVEQKELDAVGSFRVTGTAASALDRGAGIAATLTVFVTAGEPVNVAPDSTTRSATFTEPGYSIDGTVNRDLTDKAWSNWRSGAANSSDTLTYTWSDPQPLESVVLTAFRDGAAPSWPTEVAVSYVDALTGQRVTTAGVAVEAGGSSPVATVDLSVDGHPALTSSIDVQMTAAPDQWMTISEVQAFSRRATPASAATLARLNVDGEVVNGFDPGTSRYEVTVDGSRWPDVSAVASDGAASVVIGNVDAATGRIPIDVVAADGTTSQTYEVIVARRAVFLADPHLQRSGQQVSIMTATDPADATLQVVWLRDGVTQAQTGPVYALGAEDAGTTLGARVTAVSDGFLPTAEAAVALVIPADANGSGGSGGSPGPGSGSGAAPGGAEPSGASTPGQGSSPRGAVASGRLGATGSPDLSSIAGTAAILLILGAGALTGGLLRRRRTAVALAPSLD